MNQPASAFAEDGLAPRVTDFSDDAHCMKCFQEENLQ